MKPEKKARTRFLPDDRRQQILEAAATLFIERGFEAVGMPDIAAALGVARPTVYKYFGSTDAMLGPLFEAALDAVWGELAPLFKVPATLELVLDLEAIFLHLVGQERLLLLLHSGGGPVFQRYRRTLYHRLLEVVKPFEAPNRHPYQRLMLAVLLEEMAFRAITEPTLDRRELGAVLASFVAKGMNAPLDGQGVGS